MHSGKLFTLQELSHKFYSSAEALVADVEEYVCFYNTLRSHERPGDKTPEQIEAEYWNAFHANSKAADPPDVAESAAV